MRELTSAERALRRAVNPLSTAITMFVQTVGRPRRRAMLSPRRARQTLDRRD